MAMGLVVALGVGQQALQLQHGLARQDHFLLGHFHVERGAGKRQAVAVGGHQAELLAFGHKQDAVEVVADVVHRHGKRHLVEQVFRVFCGTLKVGPKLADSCTSGKSSGGRVCSVKLAFAAFEDQLACGLPGSRSGRRHGAQDVDQLACTHGGGEVAIIATQFDRGADLDFEVAGGQLHLWTGFADQHVGQNGQGVPALHDAGHRLQCGQYGVLGGFQNDHVLPRGVSAVLCGCVTSLTAVFSLFCVTGWRFNALNL
jgi:hypothetical protein